MRDEEYMAGVHDAHDGYPPRSGNENYMAGYKTCRSLLGRLKSIDKTLEEMGEKDDTERFNADPD